MGTQLKICSTNTNNVKAGIMMLNSGCEVDILVVGWKESQELMHEEWITHHVQLMCSGKLNKEISKLLKKENIEHTKKYVGKKCWKFLMERITLDELIPKLRQIEI